MMTMSTKDRNQILPRIVAATVLAVVLIGVWGGQVAASVPLSLDESQEMYTSQMTELHTDLSATPPLQPPKSKTRAPEPSTLALFFSGILGTVISFIRRVYVMAKRAFDVAIALLAFVVLSPLFVITAIMIKCTSNGPIIYKQIRSGKNGVPFWIYKFRTMRVDAEKETGAVWASKNDPRLTPIGKFLRRTRIDEIPQFYNVLVGDMSFVGPRPERPEFVERFKSEITDYEKRLQVKPGITGLAQVWHSYDETVRDVRKKIMFDILYIKKLCLLTDLQIFFRTFRVVLTGAGAK